MAANIFAEILSWSKQLTPWQNEAIRRLFANSTLSSDDKKELIQLAQIEHGLLPQPGGAPDLMLKEGDLPAPPKPGNKIKLKGISEVSNVNILKANQNLSIGDQLTVICGENASGKSGYARIMKKAFRARAVDPILPNVYAKAPNVPGSAIFKIEENGAVRDEKWVDGVPSAQCLTRFAVFDSKCARAYINDDSQLSFVPYGFDIIDGLGAITSEVKRHFLDLANSSTPKPDALKLLIDNTDSGKFVGGINQKTTEDEIKARGQWTEADGLLLTEKENSLAKLKATAPQTLRDSLNGIKKQIVTVRNSIKSLQDGISDPSVEGIKNSVDNVLKLEDAVNLAAKAAFGDLDFPGIGGNAWRDLLLAAARYSMSVVSPNDAFPASEPDAKCVLCLQPLADPARDRLKRFWDFIQDDISKQRDKAKAELASNVEELSKLPRVMPKEIEIFEETLRAAGSKVFVKAKAFYPEAAIRLEGIEKSIAENAWNGIQPAPASLLELCDGEIAQIDEELASIVDDEKINQSLKTLTSEIAELNSRKRLSENLQSVLDHLIALRLSAQATLAYTKITTNGISLKASELQTKFVTDAFKKRVREELEPLNLTRAKADIDKKGEKGKVLHKLMIDGAANVPLDVVFSEGERTALSFSCFLAELSASDDNCGIIFDDPVSSLDHRVRRAIVERLVAEAKVRQVIIFTHDLVFHRELAAAAEKQNIQVDFQNVEAIGTVTGILSNDPPWPVAKVKQRLALLEQVLGNATGAEKEGDMAKYRSNFGSFYASLRSTWERSVEEVLFNQVVQRYEKNVKTLNLSGVRVDDESIEAIFKGMTRSSEMIDAHDHAAAENPALPGSAELKKDLEHFKDFIIKQKAKIAAAEKANAHLKK